MYVTMRKNGCSNRSQEDRTMHHCESEICHVQQMSLLGEMNHEMLM